MVKSEKDGSIVVERVELLRCYCVEKFRHRGESEDGYASRSVMFSPPIIPNKRCNCIQSFSSE
jgi:hypothetical protein